MMFRSAADSPAIHSPVAKPHPGTFELEAIIAVARSGRNRKGTQNGMGEIPIPSSDFRRSPDRQAVPATAAACGNRQWTRAASGISVNH